MCKYFAYKDKERHIYADMRVNIFDKTDCVEGMRGVGSR